MLYLAVSLARAHHPLSIANTALSEISSPLKELGITKLFRECPLYCSIVALSLALYTSHPLSKTKPMLSVIYYHSDNADFLKVENYCSITMCLP